MNTFKSVLKEASAEIIEKKSRFICSIKPVKNEEEAVEFIRKISSIYKDATHNVYAYVVSSNIEIQKASDAGEPQGTAGIPVLEVIKREGLTNVCVVVTRYFGGILLGAGGLIRAYSSSARSGIIEAGICTMELYYKISITINYTQLGRVQNALTSLGNTIINIEYTDIVKLYVKARHDRVDRTISSITEITNGEAVIDRLGSFYDLNC